MLVFDLLTQPLSLTHTHTLSLSPTHTHPLSLSLSHTHSLGRFTCPMLVFDLLTQLRAPYRLTAGVLIYSVRPSILL